ncbi:putative glycolipid-binding domain-containing protein [Rubellimicrobium arenae]|uniref:putative glycolipid-binding domain-containing protein n=1 Tax=Rubellimicrobium arenae TaxID=2817372 RepID=UPI001B3141AC|nr:putative glycolipid-binding domain-containing protein [Rubellimicrobium arenae]
MTFRAPVPRDVRWRPEEGEGLEHLSLRPGPDAVMARGVVVGARGGPPYGVHYAIACDAAWQVVSLDLWTTDGRLLRLRSDEQGSWTDGDGHPLPAFEGCLDIDLAGSPFTNTLPIRRLALAPEDGPVELKVLFVPFDDFEPVLDLQRYRCIEPSRLYRFEAVDGTFAADLPVDEDGLVVDYPGLFRRVDPGR